ncbi:MAG: four helix bundle protein [Planctomycetota bacterium]|jgi:four helix bundle protein
MNRDELIQRSQDFAHRCVKLAVSLPKTELGKHIQKQLIRAACIAHSRASFTSKFSIVIEEVDETFFWLEFITDEKLIKKERIIELQNESKELTSIFMASRKTLLKNNK